MADHKVEQHHEDIFQFWNAQDIIKHRTLTNLMVGKINIRMKEGYSVEEIKNAISNYSFVVKSPYYWFSFHWTLDLFLSRSNGFPLFNDDADPRMNMKMKDTKDVEKIANSVSDRHREAERLKAEQRAKEINRLCH